MPRTARLDIQGLLQHVIVRGIERCDIFLTDDDRNFFVQRFSSLLEKTGTVCYAWALLSTHLHLLLSPRKVTLASFMRRLLTSYAITFNLRHNRSGHLFQNRYKSIVCDEDEYLLELVRYIHLNPVRAGIVTDVGQLERYPWSGHSVLMGKTELAGQDSDSVLGLFGNRAGEARRRYRLFVQDGIAQGRRGDLVGQAANDREQISDQATDARILGDSDFVSTLQQHENLSRRIRILPALSKLTEQVATRFDIPVRALAGRSRSPEVVKARAVVCHLAMLAGHSAAEIGRYLAMSRYGACAAAGRGKKLSEENEELLTLASHIDNSTC